MYPVDRRKLAIHVYSLFSSLRKTADILQVSHSTVSRWLKCPERKKYCRSIVSKTSQIIHAIKAAVINDPFISLVSLQKVIRDMFKFDVSKELLRVAIASCNYSKKKARFFGVPRDLAEKTKIFVSLRDDYVSKHYNFFSLDETSFGRNTKTVKGYSLKGHQLKLPKVVPRITTSSYVVMASNDCIVGKMQSTKSFNTTKLLEFLKSMTFPEKSVILLDNVAFHHSKVIKSYAAENHIVLLYTPPYSPWFNPIEGIFSIVKRNYYKNGDIDNAFKCVKTSHCQSFFKDSMQKK